MSDTQPPDERHLRVGEPETLAVGVPGVAVSMRYALAEMGAVRSVRTLLRVNQADGFDCPSLRVAGPGAEDRKHAEFCENGAKAVAWEATRKRVDAEFFAAHSIAFLRSRPTTGSRPTGRLTEPMYLAPGAHALRADRVGRRVPADRGQAASRWTTRTGPCSTPAGARRNEAAFAYQLFARRLGTNNLPDCSNMCHESSGVGPDRRRSASARAPSRSRTSPATPS